MIIYDSYSTEHKNPFGAVKSNENIVFCVKVKDSLETDHVNIVFRKSQSKSFRLEKGESKDGKLKKATTICAIIIAACTVLYFISFVF